MYPILISYDVVLDKEACMNLLYPYQEVVKSNLIGIYFENLKYLRVEALYFLKSYCEILEKKIIVYSIPNELRDYFFLENIPVKMGCAFFNF
ncbi:MAG: hypothetical protein ACK4UJ_09965 [Leptonema sp. (in: bacteria)]